MRRLVITLMVGGLLGCARKPAPSTTATAASPAAQQTQTAAQPEAEREKNPRIKDAAVYLDGKIVGFLKYHELPTTLAPLPSTKSFLEFGFVSYLTSIGVDVAKVRGLHMHGGRVSILSGDAVRRGGDAIRFTFNSDGTGKPRPHFVGGIRPSLGLNTAIDMISAVAVYVDKEPPHENADYDLSYPDGTAVSGMAYADAEASAGTRVYMDDKLVSIVKRKTLSNDLLANDDLSKPQFSLVAYLKSNGVDASKAKTVDFIANDIPLARIEPSKLGDMTFAVPARNQGLAVIDLENRPGQRITAIKLFQSKPAPRRTPSSPADKTAHKG